VAHADRIGTDPTLVRRFFALQALVAFFLVIAIVAYATRVTQTLIPGVLFDPGARHASTLSHEMRSWVQNQRVPLTATLFLSADEQMPTHLKQVGPVTRQFLAALKDAVGASMQVRIIDPDRSGAQGAAYAASARVSPIRVRQVVEDQNSETTIWSSLVLSRPGHADVLMQGIEAEHLPHLQQWVLSHLLSTTRSPRFAVDLPKGYQQLAAHLAQHGPVYDASFTDSAMLPPDADLFVWVQPSQVTDAHIARLRSFLASGRSVVLAGSPYAIVHEDTTRFHAVDNGPAWANLLRAFGLFPVPDLLMDRNDGPVRVTMAGGEKVEIRAPYHLRNLPAFRDFRPLSVQARGGLAFAGAGALQIDTERLQGDGWQAHVAATTTQFATVNEIPMGSTPIDSLSQDLRVPKQNLMVLLTSHDPWAGQMLVLSAPTPFADMSLSQPGYGHGVFVRDLVRALANDDRLVQIDVHRQAAQAIAPTSSGERFLWRLLVIAGVPAVWLWVALRRLRKQGEVQFHLPRMNTSQLAPALLLVLAWFAASPLNHWRIDLTADNRHSLTEAAIEALESIPELQLDLILSSAANLPPRLKRVIAQLQNALATADVELTVHTLDGTSSKAQQWTAAGIRPFAVQRVAHDTSRVARVISGLSLKNGQRQTVIPRLDEQTIPHLDFLLVSALERLQQGHRPKLTVVSDLPRLSPAEALEDFQKKGLSAPRGVDVYSQAKQMLEDYGYQIQHVSLREPQFPADSDAVLWFQPRRDASSITASFSQHLAQGGRAVVALQHYNIQQRQYRGAGFATVHWPQPQFQDLQRYLEIIGIDQPREVLMDRSQHALQLDTQVNRSATREYNAQQVALPFLLRVVAKQQASGDQLTRRLGDLLFIWGNRFHVTDAMRGLQVDTLVTTSDHAWAYDWRGGWLPPESFEPASYLPGAQPLVVRLRGRFPAVRAARDSSGARVFETTATTQSEGQLVLIGSSEMFKDPHLRRPPFAHDQLLLNAVADAVYDDDLLRLQARTGGTHRGFQPPDQADRTAWRLAVTGLGPGLFGLLGLWRWGRRRWQ
jgi:hypothetical protein